MDLVWLPTAENAASLIQNYLQDARLLGERTAQLHSALSADPDDPAFAPEPFSDFYRIGLYHSLLGDSSRVIQQLRQGLRTVPAHARENAEKLLEREADLRNRFRPLRDRKVESLRIRNHGEYHLGRVLWTGSDFVIFGFHGETERPVSERRMKRSCLRDVGAMLRSFHYASAAVFHGAVPGIRPTVESAATLEQWGRFWYEWVCAAFLRGYFDSAGEAVFLPKLKEERRILLEIYQIERALIEVRRELEGGREWLSVPLGAILELLEYSSCEPGGSAGQTTD
jgi:maltose alpha-D-glucosyltransferase/alpha-amylase